MLWQTPNQLLLYDTVEPSALPSAVRLNAMARQLGILVGPAVGSIIMLALGPSHGIIFNTLFYLPAVIWLFYAPSRSRDAAPRRIAVRGFADIIQTIRDIGTQPVLTSMTLLAGLTSFMIGNAYHAQMPGFAGDLGHGDPGAAYSVLLAADAAGALLAGIALEAWSRLKPTPRTAIILAALWSLSLLAFASSPAYALAIALLFAAGFFELSFNTMAQALVQIHAPADIRGRVVGLYNMAGLGMRAFSGITVGLAGAAIGIHWSLGLSARGAAGLSGGSVSTGCKRQHDFKSALNHPLAYVAAQRKAPPFRRGPFHSRINPATDPGASGPGGWGSGPDGPGPAAAGRASGHRLAAADRASVPGSGSAGPDCSDWSSKISVG